MGDEMKRQNEKTSGHSIVFSAIIAITVVALGVICLSAPGSFFNVKNNENNYTVSTTEAEDSRFAAETSVCDDSETALFSAGTSADPYIIGNAADMVSLSAAVAGGNTYSGSYFKVADGVSQIDLGNFTPIGNTTYYFQGSFDGNGVDFKLAITGSSSYRALFGAVGGSANIRNLSVSGSVSGSSFVAGVVAYMNSTSAYVQNVYNTANITVGSNYGGGVAGYINAGCLQYAYNTGTITGGSYIGGAVGYTYGYSSSYYNTVRYCYNRGWVSGASYVGGVVGYGNGTGNTKTYLYYDTSVNVVFEPSSGKIKPVYAYGAAADTSNVAGINGGQFFASSLSIGSASYWTFKDKTNDYGYYPQLSVFATSTTAAIRTDSLTSVISDITDGVGSSDIPFVLRSIDNLNTLRNKINKGNNFSGFYFKMELSGDADSISLGNFTPLGSTSYPFYGNFDGNNTEFVLSISTTSSYVGLFGYYGVGTIKNLSVSGTVSGASYVGGIVGYKVSGTVTDVYNKAKISGTGSHVAGIVGKQDAGTVSYAYNTGDIASNSSYAGGIVGYLYGGMVTRVFNKGEITAASSYAGGLVGYCYGNRGSYYNTVSYGYSFGTVASNDATVGGVIGGIGGYSNQGNGRSYLYYDLSVTVNYLPTKTYKPIYAVYGVSDQTYVKGMYGNTMIASGLGSNGFSSADWAFTPTTESGDTAYYPQLQIFSTNSDTRVSAYSLSAVTIDIGGGLGTSTLPFLIKSASDMVSLSTKVAAGNTFAGFYFKVNDGISQLSLGNFSPIGNSTYYFQGSFDGNSVDFKLAITGSSSYRALFGAVGGSANIRNLSVSGSVSGSSFVAGVVAYMNSTSACVQNVYNTANITVGSNNGGGVAGYINAGCLQYAYNTGTVTGGSYIGGVVGYTYGSSSTYYNTVRYCYNRGLVSATSYVGGVVGYGTGTGNTKTYLYYDTSVNVVYEQSSNRIKPVYAYGAAADTANVVGITSGQFFASSLSIGSASYWTYKDKTSDYGYYPQLTVFSGNTLTAIATNSLNSVTVDIGGGLGTADLPFIIKNSKDIEALRVKINKGNTFSGFYFKVELEDESDSISLGNFTPLGSTSYPFYGNFDGNNTEFILSISTSSNYVGLFGYYGVGTIKNLSVSGTVSGASYVGGIVGYKVSGTVTNVYNKAKISGTGSIIGGIVGRQDAGTVSYAYNTGDITSNSSYAGGIVGYLYGGTVTRIFNKSEVTAASSYAGGLVGYCYGYKGSYYNTVSYGYSFGTVASNDATVGGVIGGIGGYSNQGNGRSYLYYDLSVTVNYLPTKTYKPAYAVYGVSDQTYVKGLDGSVFLASGMNSYGFSTSDWTFLATDNGTAYYPQLKVFSNSSERIAAYSLDTVTIDISGGLGTSAIPFLITCKADMDLLSTRVNAGNTFAGVLF
jgi:hypothetical protein